MKRTISFVLSMALVLCLGITMISAEFTPSAESKDVPPVVSPNVDIEDLPEGVEPEDVAAVIVNAEDNVYVVASSLSLISVADAKNFIADGGEAQDEELLDLCQGLIDAYGTVADAGVPASIPGIDELADSLGIQSPEYTVPFIFELSVGNDEASDALNAEGAYITLTFDLSDIDVGSGTLLVAHMVGEEWVIVPLEKTVLDRENRTLTVSFDSLCPVMFISVEEGEETDSESATDSGSESESESESGSESGSESESSDVSESLGESEETESLVGESEVVTDEDVSDETEPLQSTEPHQTEETDESESESETDKKQAPKDDDNTVVVVIVICAVVAVVGACAIVFFILRKKGVIVKLTKKSKKTK